MKKRMILMLVGLGILFGAIIAFHIFKNIMIQRYMAANKSPIVTVTSMKVHTADWQPRLNAVGTVRAVQGVNVTTESAGLVDKIYFTAGASVNAGDVLVQLNADADNAYLHSLQANAELAAINYKRDKAQFAAQAISKANLDTDLANLKSINAQVEQQAAIVARKTIRAPFSGKLGIRNINLGQYLNPGDSIVSLQTYDPIYVDFFVPQQQVANLKLQQAVKVSSDALGEEVFTGTVTTIDPALDPVTRNVKVEATVSNPQRLLVPGMFASVTVDTGTPQSYITLPQTAVSFNPYGEMVYLLEKPANVEGSPPDADVLTAQQVFVTTGETRGDQITILKGIKVGDEVVTSGQMKLKNGSRVKVDNRVQPSNNPHPVVHNEG